MFYHVVKSVGNLDILQNLHVNTPQLLQLVCVQCIVDIIYNCNSCVFSVLFIFIIAICVFSVLFVFTTAYYEGLFL